MEIQSLKMAFFSPTGTTKAVIEDIARGIGQTDTEFVDITSPDARKQKLQASPNDVLVVAVPVYSGRVPAVLTGWLNTINGQGALAVCVAVYGNREFDDALLELKDILTEQGCKPIAGAAFIGEHSFSSAEFPVAVGRPDEKDSGVARKFGEKIKAKVASITATDHIPDLKIPGKTPYKEGMSKPAVDFIAVSEACTQCAVCADNCPVGAIDSTDCTVMDAEKCIWCCACIKNCPENARTMKDGMVKEIAARLNQNCQARKEPEIFL